MPDSATSARGPRRVVHVMQAFGVPSEPFIADAIAETDRLGWEAWLAPETIQHPGWFSFPPDERVIRPVEPSLPARALERLSLTPGADRSAARLLPGAIPVRPALVHAHFGWAGLPALPLARRLGVPLLVSFHGSDVTVAARFRRRELLRRLSRKGGHRYSRLFPALPRVTAVSGFLERLIRDLGFEGRIDIVPAGVCLERFPFREPARKGPLKLVFVGRQVPVKGFDVLLRALPTVLARFPETSLTALGDGPQRASNELLARELGIASRVEFQGDRRPAEVSEQLHRSDMLVLSSRTMADGAAEGGAPVVIKEALAVGLPVVATDGGGTPEAVPPQLRDELAPPGDATALAARICDVASMREDWPRRARIGRDYVEREFDCRRIADRLARIYEELLGPPATVGRPTIGA